MLLYTSKGIMGSSHFRIRGLLPLRGMLVSSTAVSRPYGSSFIPSCDGHIASEDPLGFSVFQVVVWLMFGLLILGQPVGLPGWPGPLM